MMRFVARANEPARRFKILWNLCGFAIAALFLVIGAGYAVGGKSAIASNTLNLIYNLESPIGGYHAHGIIMMVLALGLTNGLGHYRPFTRWCLIAILFYSLLVAVLIFGGWFIYSVSFAAPFWYLFVAFLSGLLIMLAPPDEHEQPRRGDSSA